MRDDDCDECKQAGRQVGQSGWSWIEGGEKACKATR